MNRVKTALLGAALCAAALTFAVPASATAEPPAAAAPAAPAKAPASAEATCAGGLICFWQHVGWTGWQIDGTRVLSGRCNNLQTLGGTILDAWSVSSNITTVQRLWEHPNCTGRNFLLEQGGVPDAGFGISSYGGY